MAPATAYWEGVAQRAGRVMVCVGCAVSFLVARPVHAHLRNSCAI